MGRYIHNDFNLNPHIQWFPRGGCWDAVKKTDQKSETRIKRVTTETVMMFQEDNLLKCNQKKEIHARYAPNCHLQICWTFRIEVWLWWLINLPDTKNPGSSSTAPRTCGHPSKRIRLCVATSRNSRSIGSKWIHIEENHQKQSRRPTCSREQFKIDAM